MTDLDRAIEVLKRRANYEAQQRKAAYGPYFWLHKYTEEVLIDVARELRDGETPE